MRTRLGKIVACALSILGCCTGVLDVHTLAKEEADMPTVMSMCCALLALWSATTSGQPDEDSGYALDFDGVDDYVLISDPAMAWGPLTVEAWIRPDTFDDGVILSNRNSGNGFDLDVTSAGVLRFAVNGTTVCTFDISDRAGQWCHVAAVWQGCGIDHWGRLYVDGVAGVASYDGPCLIATYVNLNIGRAVVGTNYFDGAIDEVRVIGTAVDEATLLAWMNEPMGPAHPFWGYLVGAWSFDEGSGQAVVDSGWREGCDGQLGSSPESDASDPTWIASGMVAVEAATWSAVKALFVR
jgi:hypothetical protein